MVGVIKRKKNAGVENWFAVDEEIAAGRRFEGVVEGGRHIGCRL